MSVPIVKPVPEHRFVRRSCLIGLASLLAACAGPPRQIIRREDTASVPAFPRVDRMGEGGGPDTIGILSEALAREVTFLALSLVDTPYRWGGNTPQGGFDCSGLIVYVFDRAGGVRLPRTVEQLTRVGQPLRPEALRTGDLVFFDTIARFSHAGIFVGEDRFVHAPSRGGLVRLDRITTRYWSTRLSGIRRV